MKEIVQWIKRVGLFLGGIALVVWGYEANAANKAKAKEEEKAKKEKQEKSTSQSIFGSIKSDDDKTQDVGGKREQVSGNGTVIESDKQVEESSGTE